MLRIRTTYTGLNGKKDIIREIKFIVHPKKDTIFMGTKKIKNEDDQYSINLMDNIILRLLLHVNDKRHVQ